MGIDTTFYAVYGVFIPHETFFGKPKKVKRPSCSHGDEARKGKHCSTCGTKVSTYDEVDYDLADDIQDAMYDYVMDEFLEVRNNHDTVVGYLFGDSESLDKFDDKPFRTFKPFDNAKILTEVAAALSRCPKTLTLTFTDADLKFYAYVCSR